MSRATALVHNLPYDICRGSTPLLTAEKRRLSEWASESSASSGNPEIRVFIDSNFALRHAAKFWPQGSFNLSTMIEQRPSNDPQPSTKVIDLVAVLQEAIRRNTSEYRIAWHPDVPAGDISWSRAAVDSSTATAVDALWKRYHELNSEYYAGRLTAEQKEELGRIETELDAADEKDVQLAALTARVERGYGVLDKGLEKINSILDELLRP